MNLNEKWKKDVKKKIVTFPTTIRLRSGVDCLLQSVLSEFDHLNQTQIINDALEDSLTRILDSIPDT